MASSMSADERTYSPTSPTSPPPKMSHSYSSPAAVESGATSSNNQQSVTSPGPATGGKMITVPILMLDDEIVQFQVQQKALGKCLFDQVCSTLHLLESDYFGLEYDDTTGLKFWLDHEKPLSRQIGLTLVNPQMRFCVKFFTPDPAQLEEEFTRYLFCLQIKRDLAKGILQCVDKTAALMASYVVQAECGDYVAEDYPDHTYLSSYKFVPHQDEEFERKIMENHKKHIGQSPAQADLNLLETARRCELYGIKMQAAKDHEGVPLNLAVAHMGVLVFQNLTKINTFSWAKVRKLSFKRKRFLIKLHPEGYGAPNSESCTSRKGYYKDTVEFFFDGRNECKNFWKKCVEHHGFFRCTHVATLSRQKTRVISRGSSFRYSGRTQKQVVDYVRENFVRRQPFQRSQSFRRSSSAHSGVGHPNQGPGHAAVITSVSAQPLLPVDGAVSASQSCGSMALDDDTGSGSLEAPSPTRTESAQAQVHDQSLTGYSYTLPDSNDGGNNERLGAQTRTGRDTPSPPLPPPPPPPHLPTSLPPPPPPPHYSFEHVHDDDGDRDADNDEELRKKSTLGNGVGEGRDEDNVSQASYQLNEGVMGLVGGEDGMGDNLGGIVNGQDAPVNGEISYVLHRRHLGSVQITPEKESTPVPPWEPPPPAVPPRPSLDEDGRPVKPAKPSRVQVDVDHSKIIQSSPTLYARSRRSASSPKSPRSQSVDFVLVHDLPARNSYSSKDDTDSSGSVEYDVLEGIQRKKKLENLEAQTVPLPCGSPREVSVTVTVLENRVADEQEDEVVGIVEPPPENDARIYNMQERRHKFLYESVLGSSGDDSSCATPEGEGGHLAEVDLDSSTADITTVREVCGSRDDDDGAEQASPDLRSNGVAGAKEETGSSDDGANIVEEVATSFGDKDREKERDDDMLAETESLPREEIEDEEADECHNPLDDVVMFPIRTLSRISERSTSEQSESTGKDSSPTVNSRPSEELPSDYSGSLDNYSEHLTSDESPDHRCAEPLLEATVNSGSDATETYYMEIDVMQKKQLESRGVYYKGVGYDSMVSEDDTLCEEDGAKIPGFRINRCQDNDNDNIESVSSGEGSDPSDPSSEDRFEGIDVKIHVSPLPPKSPSPARAAQICPGSEETQRKHRVVLEMQVSKGQISPLLTPHRSLTTKRLSQDLDEDL